ncbi:MAG: acylneuraminate cytidylyltransferase family protein [Crocinitomicaceae bacterium]
MKILAIIPARGGSKRVPGKNIKKLGGKPLIAHSIEQAKNSKFINRIIVSTDSQEIADVAVAHGAEAPFLRPKEISGDNSTDFEVFEHILNWLKKKEAYVPDVLVQLRPTSPLRKVEDVDRAIELLMAHPEVDSARAVIEPQSSPYKMYKITDFGILEPLMGDMSKINIGDQQLPKVYRHIGTADVIWTKTIVDKRSMSGDSILAVPVDRAYSGINTQEDWDFYEFLFSKLEK